MPDTPHQPDGGPAFPHQFEDTFGHPNWRQSVGMTQRDYFAGQALMGIGAWCPRNCDPGSHEWHEARAEHAYRDADAMLAAREGGAA